MLNSTWTDFFHQLAMSGLYEDKIDELATFVSDSSKTSEDFIDFARANDKVGILTMVLGSPHVTVAHHISKHGGSLIEPATFTTLIGGSSRSPVVIFNPDHLFGTSLGIAIPSLKTLLEINDDTEVSAIDTTGIEEITIRNSIAIPPFITERILSAPDKSAHALLPMIVSALNDMDASYDSNLQVDKPSFLCSYVLEWLFAAERNQIIPVTMIPDITGRFTDHGDYLHQRNGLGSQAGPISSPPPPSLPSNSTLEAIQAEQCNTLKDLTTIIADSKWSGSKKGFEGLPPSRQEMLLNAASTNGITPAQSISDFGLEFFKQKNASHATMFLNSELRKQESGVSICQAVGQQLFVGGFNWDSFETPQGLAACILTGPGTSGPSIRDAMVIELKGRYQLMDNESIKKLTSTTVVIPTDIFEGIHLMEAKLKIAKLFLKDNAYFCTRLESGVTAFRRNYSILKQKFRGDPDLVAKIMVSVDDRTNRFFDECANLNRLAVKSEFVNYESIVTDIILGKFHYDLPPFCKRALLNDGDNSPNDEGEPRKKKKRTTPEITRVVNPNCLRELALANGEDYKDIFGNGVNSELLPKLNGNTVCPRYQIRGFCFSNCSKKVTHVDLTGRPAVCQMKEFMAKCRN